MRHRVLFTMVAVVVAAASVGILGLGAQAQQRRPPASGETASQPAERRAVPRPPANSPAPAPQRQATPRSGSERAAAPRREAPRRNDVPRRYFGPPRTYYFPPIDARLSYYYHPYFGFYFGPYYGPFYPYPGPFAAPARYSTSAIRTRVRPVEAEVYVNGYYAGIADDFDGVFQRLYVPAGEHHIELRLEGYRSFSQDLYVGPGDTFEIDHRMQRLSDAEVSAPPPLPRALPEDWAQPAPDVIGGQPASPYGVLAIHADPSDAQIVVDGEAWAMIEGQKEFVIHLAAGWHELTIRREGYQDFATKLQLTEGQTTRLNVQLVQ